MVASTTPPRLSKSRFTNGLQCHKLLWWRVHEPDATAPDPQKQAIFDQGSHVGELARLMFRGDSMRPPERTALRTSLLRYCERDTWGLAKLLEALKVATKPSPRRRRLRQA